jgi:hypothetical protein
MAYSRVFTALFAVVACTTLPSLAAGQRVVEYRSSGVTYGPSQFRQLELARTVPVRVSWNRRDLALATGFTAALLVDATQTRRLARGGWRDYRETNPVLGPRPSVGRVNTYTAVVGLSVLGAAAVAPKRVRPWVLGIAFAVEACTLAAMSQRGIAISF